LLRLIQKMVVILVLILFLSALPEIISVNNVEKSLEWNWTKLPEIYGNFFAEISKGSLGTYQLGSQTRAISGDIGDNFVTSLILMVSGVVVGVIISIVFGIFVSRFRLTRWFRLIMNLIAAIPDFILIVISLFIAIKIYQISGFRMISLRPDAGLLNMWFPIILIALSPTLYLFKLVSLKYYQTSGEDYIRTAVSKGLSSNYINFQHVFKNIEPFIFAELTKIISLAVGNLFIIEYLLNVPGITKFIFQSNQIQPIAIGLFSMLLISLIVYFTVRLLFYLFKRGFLYE
jgi:peptide/nickel transport system permease protein